MAIMTGGREENNGGSPRGGAGGCADGPGGPERSGGPAGSNQSTTTISVAPDPEVPEKAARRRFSAKYKIEILRKVDAFTEPGQIGKLLRQEGLYSSHLTTWRRQRDEGMLEGLKPRKRGRKKKQKHPAEDELRKVRRENERLRRKLAQAETIIDIQKKVSELLGIPLKTADSDDSD